MKKMDDQDCEYWPRNITTIKQAEGSKDCLACVAAMITKTSPENFKEFCRKHGFCLHDDISLFLYIRRYGFIPMACFEDEENFHKNKDFRLLSGPCYLVVESDSQAIRDAGATHAILWDGKKVHDPAPSRNGSGLRSYKVKMICSLTRITSEVDCLCGCNSVNKSQRIKPKTNDS